MKRSELRGIIREELIREGLLDKMFNHLKGVVDDDAKRRAVAQVNSEVAASMERMAKEEETMKKLLKNELSNKEIAQMIARLKGK